MIDKQNGVTEANDKAEEVSSSDESTKTQDLTKAKEEGFDPNTGQE